MLATFPMPTTTIPPRMPDRDTWIHLGRLYREAAKTLWRMELREFPVRAEWPPRLGQQTAGLSSQPERETIRRDEIECHGLLKRQDLAAALKVLAHAQPEQFMAVHLVDVTGKTYEQACQTLRTERRRLHHLLERGWALIAEYIETKGASNAGKP